MMAEFSVYAREQKERKKTDKPDEGWGEDRVPNRTSRILEGRSGTQGNGGGERIATRRGAGWAGFTPAVGALGALLKFFL